jgi:DNA (cytosine-5)-methyltransferase 1
VDDVLTVGSLFSGIGGLDLGLERAGMSVRWQCEIDPYCRAVLAHHWPGVKCYEDIRDIDGSAERVDLICGGFPCQPVSRAGRRKGPEDEKWLWDEMARVICLVQPTFALVENVPTLKRRGLDRVLGDLAVLGYDAEWVTYIADDLDGFEDWILAGLAAIDVYLARWAEFQRRHGA